MRLLGLLVILGLVWGLQVTLIKIATEAGYRDFGIVFWTAAVDEVLLLPVLLRLPMHRAALRLYVFVGLVGTLLPATASAIAAQHLPAGVVAVGLSFTPLLALPIAVMLGTDRFTQLRVLGLLLGLAGVVMIVAPGAGLASAGLSFLFLLALIAPLFYAIEGNVIARFGTAGLRPFQVVAGASFVTMMVAGPAALLSGSFIDPFDAVTTADLAIIGGAFISLCAYIGYLWMVGRAGAVFAAQVAYLVTGFGVMWSMLILNERFPPGFWVALAAIMLGIFLVQPRPDSLRALRESGKNAPDEPLGQRPDR